MHRGLKMKIFKWEEYKEFRVCKNKHNKNFKIENPLKILLFNNIICYKWCDFNYSRFDS